LQLRQKLSTAPTARQPVTYRRDFVDGYKPNETFLLPQELSDELVGLGRLPEQLPAGTYARKVLEQLLIDLSWSSSKLEGNRYSLLDTEQLFKSGQPATDQDGIMLLNHKAGIEFLVDAVPTLGLTAGLLQNLHSILMRDLLTDARSLGAIRTKLVNITGTAYVPMQAPQVLREMFGRIISTAQHIKNPVESAFFLWVNLAYLQPFEDGNKRVSRLAANIPLMLYNQAPLSFMDIDRQDYALAMMGVYEFCDVSMAADLFAWTYRRSQSKYKIVLEAMGAPDPFRIANREALSDAILLVVRERKQASEAVRSVGLSAADADKFRKMLDEELEVLEDYNCARYRLRPTETTDWIRDGRPH
jgi:Fic family protein